MRIVHLGPWQLPLRHPRGGAIERRILELGAAQAARGHQVIAYSAEAKASVTDFHGVEVRAVPCRSSGRLRGLELVTKAIRDLSDVEVLHFHSVVSGSVACAKIEAVKVLSYDHFAWRGSRHFPFH